jgi:hypothetical protein
MVHRLNYDLRIEIFNLESIDLVAITMRIHENNRIQEIINATIAIHTESSDITGFD